MRFAEFLREDESVQDYGLMLGSMAEITNFLISNSGTFKFKVDPKTLIVSIRGNSDKGWIRLSHSAGIENRGLPVRFKNFPKSIMSFQLSVFPNANLIGLPAEAANDSFELSLYECNNFKSVEGITPKINTLRIIKCRNFTSLKGIQNHLKSCKSVNLDENIKECLLPLLMIQDMERVTAFGLESFNSGIAAAADIVTRHAKGEKDLISCKRELVSAGFKEFAKL